MKSSFDPVLSRKIEKAGIIAVVTIESVRDAVPLAKALLAGGIEVIELTLRTSAALDALRAIRAEVPEMMVGAGTILTSAQLRAVIDAGAAFGVAPGLNRRIVEMAREESFSFSPGVLTPTEIELAVEAGCRLLKFFPAEPVGGLAYLGTVLVPFAHLGVKFIPLGGLNLASTAAYISNPNVAAIGGSWLAPKAYIKAGRWQDISILASEATSLIEMTRLQRNGV